MAGSISILWIDDNVKSYKHTISGLEEENISVATARSVDEAYTTLKSKDQFDLIILDLKMPGKSGFDFLRDNINPNVPVCVLSSYLHLEEYQRKLSRFRRPIGVMDKDLPTKGSASFKLFVEKIKNIALDPPSLSPTAFHNKQLGKLEPFATSYREFLGLSNRVKRHLSDKAYEEVKDILDREFQSGKVWVMICGDEREIAYSAETESEKPSSEEISNYAAERDRVPYQFSAPDSVDDLWSGSCGGPRSYSNYPTVRLQINGHQEDLHFDTGAPWSFLSFEFINELIPFEQNLHEIRGKRGTSTYYYIEHELKGKIVDQGKQGVRKAMKLEARIVKDWEKSPYIVKCPSDCKNKQNSNITFCKNRLGLIGRDLLFGNSIKITLCGTSNKTSIVKR